MTDEFDVSRQQRRAMMDSLTIESEGQPQMKPKKAINTSEAYRFLPEEYKKHQQDTEPLLHFVEKLGAIDPEGEKLISLEDLLLAAEKDVELHQARIKASLAPTKESIQVLQSYDPSQDTGLQERLKRKSDRLNLLNQLQIDSFSIMQDLKDMSQKNDAMTKEEHQQVQLARWQKALELYVYAPSRMELDLLGLLEKLIQGAAEEEEFSDILSHAAQMCDSLVDVTGAHMLDAAEDAAEAEDGYQVRLEAHARYARQALHQSESIQSQFRTNGRAALQIGHQLEFAESKRRQCESASILIRRWWMMESLAESEQVTGEPLRVEEEVRGTINAASSRMDRLFTLPSNSLEASKALKQLRAVCKSRGNAAASMSSAGGLAQHSASDPHQKRRFDWTENLINRTSDALEGRLLNDFTTIYSRGGAYDFSENPRPGSIEWMQLRELAQALLLFGSGKNLHNRYVDMVITSRFPELFASKKPVVNQDENEFDMDATRSELSSLFHRVSDVCTAEFELIAHVFGAASERAQMANHEEMTLTVARALLQRVISDSRNGLQARISELLESIDRRGGIDSGAKKLDTFVVIHEKAAGLFHLLKEAAEKMLSTQDDQAIRNRRRSIEEGNEIIKKESTNTAVTALKQFLTSQEIALSSGHRRSYLNLELRLLHHDCCSCLENQAGCPLDLPTSRRNLDVREAEKGNLIDYVAPILPVNRKYLMKCDILSGPLKSSVLRQPLIHATDSLARARLMFGAGSKGGEQTARVIAKLYSQMCNFYGTAYLYPIVEALGDRLVTTPPTTAPSLPFDENNTAPDLGVPASFWVALEYIHTAAKSFDRELWAEQRPGSARVWETLVEIGPAGAASLSASKNNRLHFFADLEARGEGAIGRALTTLSEHIRWIIVSGGEAMFATGANRFFSNQGSGPYAIPRGDALETPNSPAVKGLCFCLRSQFVNIQAALTPQSLSAFWTALSVRLYDLFVPRLLQHYHVTTVGAVILSRDVEALRSVSMLAGSEHSHWDNLRELVTLYMTPPIALESMLLGPDGDPNSGKGLIKRVGRHQSLVFMSRRADYRVKTNQGTRKATWVVELLEKLQVNQDPADRPINLGYFSAERKN